MACKEHLLLCIRLSWVSAHADVNGNEMADLHAGKAISAATLELE